MLDDINLKDFPKKSGVYKLICNRSVIYIGSSKNLYKRMKHHRTCIKQGSNDGYKKDFFVFLQNNPFSIEFELTENYREIEQELIEYYKPIYNQIRAFTGCGSVKDREDEYRKEYNQKFKEEMKQYREAHKEEIKQYNKQYKETHKDELKQKQIQYYENRKEEIKQYRKQYSSQKVNYKGEVLTLCALARRFQKQGIPHPVLEAKKYLIS